MDNQIAVSVISSRTGVKENKQLLLTYRAKLELSSAWWQYWAVLCMANIMHCQAFCHKHALHLMPALQPSINGFKLVKHKSSYCETVPTFFTSINISRIKDSNLLKRRDLTIRGFPVELSMKLERVYLE